MYRFFGNSGWSTPCFRQVQSFEADLLVPELAAKEGGPASFRGVFIRAPAILETGPDVEVLADYSVSPGKSESSGSAVESQVVYHSLFFYYLKAPKTS